MLFILQHRPTIQPEVSGMLQASASLVAVGQYVLAKLLAVRLLPLKILI